MATVDLTEMSIALKVLAREIEEQLDRLFEEEEEEEATAQ